MFNSLFDGFISLFGQNFNDGFIIFITALSVYWFVNYDLIRLLGIKRSLQSLNDRISALEGYDVGNILRLDRIFSANMDDGLKNAWEACYHDSKQIMNKEKTLDIKEYFNLYQIVTIPARRKRVEATPGIISMLGILGTFLSIMGEAGLKIAAVSSAFSIAIAAFILSILFVILDRQLYQSTISELKLFLDLAGRKIPMASESGSLERLIGEQRGQKEAIENMGAGISEQLGAFLHKELVPTFYKSFDESINRQIAPSIKAMCDTICRVSELTANIQQKGMQDIANSFANKLMTTKGVEFDRFKESFNTFLESYEKSQGNTNSERCLRS